MIALTALFLIGLLGLIAFGIARVFVLDIKNEDTKFLVNFILAIVVAFIPISPEVIGSIKFKRQCESMAPARYFIPANADKLLFNDPELYIQRRGNRKWDELVPKIYGNQTDFSDKKYHSEVSSFPFKVVSTHVSHFSSNVKIKEYEIYRSEGSWLNKFFGHWVQYQCFSPGTYQPESYSQIEFTKQ